MSKSLKRKAYIVPGANPRLVRRWRSCLDEVWPEYCPITSVPDMQVLLGYWARGIRVDN